MKSEMKPEKTIMRSTKIMKCNDPCNCGRHAFGRDCMKHGSLSVVRDMNGRLEFVTECDSDYTEQNCWIRRARLGVADEETSPCGVELHMLEDLRDAADDEELLRIARQLRDFLTATDPPYDPWVTRVQKAIKEAKAAGKTLSEEEFNRIVHNR